MQVILTDDMDGSDASETLRFALRGTEYEIDLSAKNAAKLDKALSPYVAAARKTGRKGTGRHAAANGSAGDASKMRAWAIENGYAVGPRGRISADIRAAYEARNTL